MDKHLQWDLLTEELIHKCRIFDLYSQRMTTAAGHNGQFYVLKAPDWVTVIPVLTLENGEKNFIMVKQFRQGIQKITYEFPAGLKEPGETPLQAAERELKEETGYVSGDISQMSRIAPTPAFMDNWSHSFIARNLRLVSDKKLDENELLDVMEIPVKEVLSNMGLEPFTNSQTVVSLFFYLKHEGLIGADRIRTDA